MSLKKSSIVFAFFTSISRILGFIRDVIIAKFLGAGFLSDAFFFAIKIPNLFRKLFGEGALNASFIPIYSKELKKDKEQAKVFANRVFTKLFLVLFTLTIIAEIAMPFIVSILGYGFRDDPNQLKLTILLSRIAFPYLILISLTALLSGILNSFNRFAEAAAAPILLNLTLIASIFLLKEITPTAAHSLSIGFTISGFLQFYLIYKALQKRGAAPKFTKPVISQRIKFFLHKLIPGIIGVGIYNINITIDTIFATHQDGAVSWLYYAQRLTQLPLALIGTAIATVILPSLSKQNLKERTELTNKALDFSLFLTFPATIFLFIGAFPFISILFERGAFSSLDAYNTALALKVYVIGLPAIIIGKILTANFHAKGNTKTPVKISFYTMIINVALNFILFPKYKFVGITIASSISAYFLAFHTFYLLWKRNLLKISNKTIKNIATTLILAGFIGIIAYAFTQNALENWLKYELLEKILYIGSIFATASIAYLGSTSLILKLNLKDLKFKKR
jgi:putative peptidoglycan lipid II flippase